MKIAFFPGSFDPITLGHINIIKKSEKIFDKIVIGIGENHSKKSWLSTKEKIIILKACFKKNKKISIQKYNGLTIDYCNSNNIHFIIRGIRDTLDFQYENRLALMNEQLSDSVISVFIPCSKKYSEISSTLVKDIIKHKGNFERFLPSEILPYIKNKKPY